MAQPEHPAAALTHQGVHRRQQGIEQALLPLWLLSHSRQLLAVFSCEAGQLVIAEGFQAGLQPVDLRQQRLKAAQLLPC